MNFLIIQTAFIGDAILASSIIEKLHIYYPEAKIDFLVRQGNENLFQHHPIINHLYIWNKKRNKYGQLFQILKEIRISEYDYLINLQRFVTTGFLTAFSKAKTKIGFKKNPLSFLFNQSYQHKINNGKHEIERNHELIMRITDGSPAKPKLYPTVQHYDKVEVYKQNKYICISPASVWFTKQYPKEGWLKLIEKLDTHYKIYLLGGSADVALCDKIIDEVSNKKIENLAGKLNLLESAALMKDAEMNYTNDSAPLHLCSAMNAPVRSVFCSTVPEFGFGPLSSNAKVVQVKEQLACRPCGLHGKKTCPEEHFKCAYDIDIADFIF